MSHRVAGATNELTEWAVGGGKKRGLPAPATAAGGLKSAVVSVAKEVVEGQQDVANGGVPEAIPLMGEEGKEGPPGTPDIEGNDSRRVGWASVSFGSPSHLTSYSNADENLVDVITFTSPWKISRELRK